MAERKTFTRSECPTGVVRYFGFGGDPGDGPRLAYQLSKVCPVTVICSQEGIAQVSASNIVDYVFSWLPPEAQAIGSPAVFTPKDYAAVLKKTWGQGTLVSLFTRRPQAEIVGLLRAATAIGPLEKPTAVRGICWPSALAAMLDNVLLPELQNLTEAIDVVFLEDQPTGGWRAYSTPNFPIILQRFDWLPAGEE